MSLLIALFAILASLFGGSVPAPRPTEPAAISDGRHFATLLRGETGGEDGAVLEFDVASFLTGAEAAAACDLVGDECPPPNDYLIHDDDPGVYRVAIDANAPIDLVNWADCCETRLAGTTADLLAAIAAPDEGGIYRIDSRFWLTITLGRITAVEEQYLP